MDYSAIDSILSKKSLSDDPAFDALTISVEPTPDFNGCPLGLYYPDSATIIIPSDGQEGTLLHELGHRHGHYYYGDLSEDYAEYFRKIYQKGRALLYQGNHFERLSQFGKLFQEGEKGAVEIALARPITRDELSLIESSFYGYGETIPRLYHGGNGSPWVRVEFTKGVDWMVIIGASLAASVLITVGALGYAVYKVSDELPWIVPVSVVGAGMFFLLRAMAKETVKRIPSKVKSYD